MEVIVHYPESADAKQILSQKILKIHLQFVMYKIDQLHLSKEDSGALIKMMCDKLKL